MEPFQMTPDEVEEEFNTSIGRGLSEIEAKSRLKSNGPNRLKEEEEKSLLLKFAHQLKDVMILILLAAVTLSLAAAFLGGGENGILEPVLILLILVINAVLGLVEENRAEKSLEVLKELSLPKARVVRGGVESIIDAENLVRGDIIYLEAGDFVPADARLYQAADLMTDESTLTGESLPVEKSANVTVAQRAPLCDRANMVYSGCAVSRGTGRAIVTATGMGSEIGKIAGTLSREKPESTPLQKRLVKLGRHLGIVVIVACAVIFLVGIINDTPVIDMLMVAVSLAVSTMPEGLAAIVTVVLSIGAQRLVRGNAIVRKLSTVEDLGGVSVICLGKTETLTMDQMTVTHVWPTTAPTPMQYSEDMDSRESGMLLGLAAMCCDGDVIFKDNKEEHIGDPTETAIIKAAHLMGMPKESLAEWSTRVMELPFDSERRLMTTVQELGDGQYIVITKGPVDTIGKCCVPGDMYRAEEVNLELSRHGLRVLAVAIKTIKTLPDEANQADLESELNFLGLIGMMNLPRQETKEAVELCRRAGIKPVMITGDHKATAIAVAEQLDIYRPGDRAVSATELEDMEDSVLSNCIRDISVFARVSPQDKIRIIKAWKAKGDMVAMTGGCIDDAPVLKAADIGCAMGVTGTDVAKEAADLVLADDNFATVIAAVREGRGVYENIKKVIGFLLGTNIGELLTVFFAMMLWGVSPLISVQLLWINLITGSLPAVALGAEPVNMNIMSQKPRPKNEGIMANGLGLSVFIQGSIFAVLALFAFKIGVDAMGIDAGRTMAFIVLALTQLVHSFSMRSRQSLFKIGFFRNRKLISAVLVSLIMVLLIVFIPQVAYAFGMTKLSIWMYIVALALSFIPFPLMEIIKAVGF